MRPLTGSVGDAVDNALAESFFATLECEPIDRRSFRIRGEARLEVVHFIEGWYDTDGLHSSLGYESPVRVEGRANETVVWRLTTGSSVDSSRTADISACADA